MSSPWTTARCGDAELSRLPQIDLHLAQPRRLPRHSNEKPMKDGDIVNIDVTLIVDGWHGDSTAYAVGDIPRRAERLIEITYNR